VWRRREAALRRHAAMEGSTDTALLLPRSAGGTGADSGVLPGGDSLTGASMVGACA
jgi:hypothetical protein